MWKCGAHCFCWLSLPRPSRRGGEAQRITNLENGASNFEWAPDGTRFLCLTRTGPSTNKNTDVRQYTHISYKFNDTGWFDEKRSHLVVVDAKTGAAQANHR